jgi:hypothetical protein
MFAALAGRITDSILKIKLTFRQNLLGEYDVAQMHVRALKSMIDARGGLPSFAHNEGLMRGIIWFVSQLYTRMTPVLTTYAQGRLSRRNRLPYIANDATNPTGSRYTPFAGCTARRRRLYFSYKPAPTITCISGSLQHILPTSPTCHRHIGPLATKR